MMNRAQYKTIDQYIKQFPEKTQAILKKVRKVIHEAAPKATEAIKYGLATFILNGNLIHFGGFKNHIGLYPSPNGINEFSEELKKYEVSKGAIRFSLDKPIPLPLIKKITRFRVKQSMEKTKSKKV